MDDFYLPLLNAERFDFFPDSALKQTNNNYSFKVTRNMQPGYDLTLTSIALNLRMVYLRWKLIIKESLQWRTACPKTRKSISLSTSIVQQPVVSFDLKYHRSIRLIFNMCTCSMQIIGLWNISRNCCSRVTGPHRRVTNGNIARDINMEIRGGRFEFYNRQLSFPFRIPRKLCPPPKKRVISSIYSAYFLVTFGLIFTWLHYYAATIFRSLNE